MRRRVYAHDVVWRVTGILSNIYLMTNLSDMTWLRLVVWLFLGMVVYFAYSIRKSKLNDTNQGSTIPMPAFIQLEEHHGKRRDDSPLRTVPFVTIDTTQLYIFVLYMDDVIWRNTYWRCTDRSPPAKKGNKLVSKHVVSPVIGGSIADPTIDDDYPDLDDLAEAYAATNEKWRPSTTTSTNVSTTNGHKWCRGLGVWTEMETECIQHLCETWWFSNRDHLYDEQQGEDGDCWEYRNGGAVISDDLLFIDEERGVGA